MKIAERLVEDLMLVSVLVAGEGAGAMVAELESAGAAAEIFLGEPSGGFDLAILLVSMEVAADPGTRAIVAGLSGASERLLFAPILPGQASAADAVADEAMPGRAPDLELLNEWFEVLAELGYQPVVDFDASFVCPGAFLVDRAATAGESELSAFADRLQRGASVDGVAETPEPAAARQSDARDRLLDNLARAEASLAATRAELAAAQAASAAGVARADDLARLIDGQQKALRGLEAANIGWDGLRGWVRAACADPSRDTPAALARDLPRLNQLRGSAGPVKLPTDAGPWRPWRRRRADVGTAAILADTALVRASPLFDAAWYVASNPDLAVEPLVDPVFHYVLVGSLFAADPGPWFDSQAYLTTHPHLSGAETCLLVDAIRTGAGQGSPSHA